MMKFLKNEDGVALVIFAVMATVIFGIWFLLSDILVSQNRYMDNQGAVDSATLSVADFVFKARIEQGANPDGTAMESYAKQVFKANYNQDVEFSKFDIRIDADFVEIESCIKSKISGWYASDSEIDVCNVAKASLPALANIEIALAIDTSSSMLGSAGSGASKINALKAGINGALDDIYNTYAQQFPINDVYWAVVPFRGMVDLGSNALNIVENDWGARRMNPKQYEVYSLHNQPSSYSSAMSNLYRVPLTERVSGNASFTSDTAPVGSNKFKAYWHHNLDYWYAIDGIDQLCHRANPIDNSGCDISGRYESWGIDCSSNGGSGASGSLSGGSSGGGGGGGSSGGSSGGSG